MKPGDWLEYAGQRFIVITAGNDTLRAITQLGSPCGFRVKEVKHLPNCTGWDWQPEPQWRPATVEDAIKALRGEVIEARFKYTADTHYIKSKLRAYYPIGKMNWISSNGVLFEICEVRA